MAEDLGDKTEAPTPRRLGEARQKGRIPKSTDLTAAVELGGALLILVLFGGFAIRAVLMVFRRTFDGLPASVDSTTLFPFIIFASAQAARALAPFLAITLVIAAISQFAQVGFNFSTDPLQPNLAKLNPIKGLSNIVGKRGIAKTLINTLKLSGVLAVAALVLTGIVASVARLPLLEPIQGMYTIARLAFDLALWLLLILAIVGVADYLYQRWQHHQDLRMTKADVKDERRAMEGDPQVKSQRFKMAQKIALQRINQNVPKADVIVTNPTHFAVAIQYDSDTMRAPKVVAKGVDHMAMRVRQVAAIHGVPIVERPPLARSLYFNVDVGHEIQPDHYQAVAEILAFVYRLEEQAA